MPRLRRMWRRGRRSTRPAGMRSRISAGRWSTAWSGRTPTSWDCPWTRRAVCWSAAASSARGGLELEQQVLRLGDLHGLRQWRVGPDDRDGLLHLVRRDRAIRQVETARGGQPSLEVADLADDPCRQPAGQVLGLGGADALLGLADGADHPGEIAIRRAPI